MRKYAVKVDDKEFIVEIRLMEDQATPMAAAVKVEEPKVEAVKPAPKAMGSGEPIKSPLAGKILKVLAGEGKKVKKGEVLLTLEALKLENEIVSPFDGTVTEIRVKEGTNVEAGEVLLLVDKA